jgi:hypothetical protein
MKTINGDLILTEDTTFDESIKVEGDIKCDGGAWNLTVRGDIHCHDIHCHNIYCHDIHCHDIDCFDIRCRDIDCLDIVCNDIDCSNIDCHDIDCHNIDCHNIDCDNIISNSIKLKKGGKVYAYYMVEDRFNRDKKVWKEAD